MKLWMGSKPPPGQVSRLAGHLDAGEASGAVATRHKRRGCGCRRNADGVRSFMCDNSGEDH